MVAITAMTSGRKIGALGMTEYYLNTPIRRHGTS
jgi:hypothetical protein